MTKVLRAYARANQAGVVVPFILGRRHGAGDQCRRHRPVAGRDHGGLCADPARAPGRAGNLRQFPVFHGAEIRLADIRHAGAGHRLDGGGATRAAAQSAAPVLGQFHHLQAAQCPGDDRGHDVECWPPSIAVPTSSCIRRASSTGSCRCPTRNSCWDCDLCGALHTYLDGIRIDDNELALDAFREVGPGNHFFGCAHTMANYQTAFWETALADNDPFETWSEGGGEMPLCAANRAWKKTLADYQAPPLDPGIAEGLADFMARKKAGMDDAWY